MSATTYSVVPQFPLTLRTATPAEGLDLARRLATDLAVATAAAAPTDMASMLRSASPGVPSLETVTAIYFHAISIANAGWAR